MNERQGTGRIHSIPVVRGDAVEIPPGGDAHEDLGPIVLHPEPGASRVTAARPPRILPGRMDLAEAEPWLEQGLELHIDHPPEPVPGVIMRWVEFLVPVPYRHETRRSRVPVLKPPRLFEIIEKAGRR